MGRDFRTRFEENIGDIRINQNMLSIYQIVITLYGIIENTMDVIRMSQQGKNPDILERFHIYKAASDKSVLNEQYATDSSVFFI
jgi:hypothetical protein